MATTKSLARQISSEELIFGARPRLIFAKPVGSILRGFCFEGSRWSKGTFYVWVFLQPMFIATDYLVFTFGFRLGGGTRTWNLKCKSDSDELVELMMSCGLPHLSHGASPASFADWLAMDPLHDDYRFQKARAYALISARHFDEGIFALRKFIDYARTVERETPKEIWLPYLKSAPDQAEQLLALVRRSPDLALKQLARWEERTKATLKVA